MGEPQKEKANNQPKTRSGHLRSKHTHTHTATSVAKVGNQIGTMSTKTGLARDASCHSSSACELMHHVSTWWLERHELPGSKRANGPTKGEVAVPPHGHKMSPTCMFLFLTPFLTFSSASSGISHSGNFGICFLCNCQFSFLRSWHQGQVVRPEHAVNILRLAWIRRTTMGWLVQLVFFPAAHFSPERSKRAEALGRTSSRWWWRSWSWGT